MSAPFRNPRKVAGLQSVADRPDLLGRVIGGGWISSGKKCGGCVQRISKCPNALGGRSKSLLLEVPASSIDSATELNRSGLPTQSPALQCRCWVNCCRSPVGKWSGRGDSGTNHRNGHRCNASVCRGAVLRRTGHCGQSRVDRIQWHSTRRKEL